MMKTRPRYTLKEVTAANKKNCDSWFGFKLDPTKITFAYSSVIGMGVDATIISAIYNGAIMGTVWYHDVNHLTKTIMILDSYVRPIYRRKGIRTAIHRELVKCFRRIVSPNGTKEGAAWMKSAGYKFNSDQGWWEWSD